MQIVAQPASQPASKEKSTIPHLDPMGQIGAASAASSEQWVVWLVGWVGRNS